MTTIDQVTQSDWEFNISIYQVELYKQFNRDELIYLGNIIKQ